MKNEERKISLPGFDLAIKLWHSEQNTRPVLCLHGKLDNAASFDLLAPYLTHYRLVAVDCPGTGLSSHYPEGVLPDWKNDAFLLLHLIDALKWKAFDIIAHSLGSLIATVIAIARPEQVKKLVFLDVLGPRDDFIKKSVTNLRKDTEIYLTYHEYLHTVFVDQKAAIEARMKVGNISYQAAEALVLRGTIKKENGWMWNYDPRLNCVNSTLPHEDELKAMFDSMEIPVCLIRAESGLYYPNDIFQARAQSIRNLMIYELPGGHHVHMDNPSSVSKIISQFL